MKHLKTIVASALLLTSTLLNKVEARDSGNFALRAGTGFGWLGPARINGGYYYGKNVNTAVANGAPVYDFKIKPIYYSLSGCMRYKHSEWALEFGRAKFESDVTNLQRRLEAKLNFTIMNFTYKYIPFQEPKMGFQPFAEADLNLWFYTYDDVTTPDVTNPNNGVKVEESNFGMYPRFSFFVGTDYYFTDKIGTYIKAGYGFEKVQLGLVYKLFDRKAE